MRMRINKLVCPDAIHSSTDCKKKFRIIIIINNNEKYKQKYSVEWKSLDRRH